MQLQLGRKPVLIISSAESAEEVLKKQDAVFADRPKRAFDEKLLYNFRDVVFAPYGEYWRQARSICVLHLLNNKRVQSFRSLREEEVKQMLEKIRESCLSGSSITVNVSEILATYANDVVSMIAIGKRYSAEEGGNQFKELFEDTTTLLGYFNVADFIPCLGWMNHINGMEGKANRVAKAFDEYLEKVVDEGMQRLEKRVASNDGESLEEKKVEEQNFVDVLLELQRNANALDFSVDRDSVKAIILDMFVAGTNTTSALLEWAISELLKNSDAMKMLQNEVRNSLSGYLPDHITEDDLGKLPYLKAVIKETLRMHPPVAMINRRTRNAVKVLGYDVEGATQVLINAWAIGRDPLLWEQPDEFQPERFLKDRSVDFRGHHFELIPFGSGRRICPGIGFVTVTVELALANLIRNLDFALAGGAIPEELDMTEAHGIVMPRKVPLLLVPSLANN
ncbi:OLC1v1032481C1 [Oldenlandia corymbosa var. corymbosa]|uniref:OLC1v1032481C1 n=1 Tax=Oldenlandia corymbosa var. corymbosa TaxID=529605 RepID=A0AAV1CL42_OLDCO|nr:OLC1v1032481C1 [Oldenlandia corymbosa var. corymbosa]